MSPTELLLEVALTKPIETGTYLSIGMRTYMLLEEVKPEDKVLVISLQRDDKPRKPPAKGTEVMVIGYEYETLVASEGKPAGDFSLGSSLVTMAWSPSVTVTGQSAAAATAKIQAPATSFINGSGQSPAFGSPPTSTALRLNGSTVYSSLEDGLTTAPCPGICFESWIKVERASDNTIAVAYTSEHSPRAEGSPKEQQTFVLGVPKPPGGDVYDLVGNINGLAFFVNQHAALKLGQWAHFSCSGRNTFALEFSGGDYIDLGNSAEWNLSDFSLVFTLQLSKDSSGDQTILVKSESASGPTPMHIKVTSNRQLQLSYWAVNESGNDPKECNFYSPGHQAFVPGEAYKVLVSRELVYINKNSSAPRSYQLVNMRAWRSDGSLHMELKPQSVADITAAESKAIINYDYDSGPQQTHGPAQGNDAPLCLGGAAWSQGRGLRGMIGSILLYSAAIQAPKSPLGLLEASGNTKGVIGSWSCRDASGSSLVDDLGRNHGKFKGDNLRWILSPYKPDLQLSIFVNATRIRYQQPSDTHRIFLAQSAPAGPRQLTLGNALVASGNDQTRFLGLSQDFCGEFDELRIWNLPRTKENICDSMNTRLTEIPSEMAVYLPFDDAAAEISPDTAGQGDNAILFDASVNCCHLTPLFGAATIKIASEAPIGHDSPCVNHTLGAIAGQSRGVTTCAGPSVAEYGDVQVGVSGAMEGSFKRAYSYIEENGKWCLVTGFRIGALKTEWVGQVQTAPTLIGFIEGAPPLPVDTFIEPSSRPTTSINFRHNKRCTYTYSSRAEHVSDIDLSFVKGAGAKWQVSAGMGVETETTSGQIKVSKKIALDVSAGLVNNEVRASTTNVNMEMGVQLTGVWKEEQENTSKTDQEEFEPSNTGLALVESEAADLFALRLQMRGPIAPLVAYQMRPNPDIPKDRNLVSFEINRAYTKQGCLDGRRGLVNDPDYPVMSSAPKDASYYKPVEAYALRERIRRAEEQRQGEFDRHSLLLYSRGESLPQRTHRNICNSYVWTADGGTFQETNSTLDMIQSEVAGNLNTKISAGASFDMELAFGNSLGTVDVDAMYSAHFNFNMTKEKTSDEGFELDVQPPPPVDIRYKDPKTGKYVKRPGAVDAFRWMSFWLEPSVEATDTFFEQVIDPVWLEESPESNARLLRSLREALAKETGNARTKAWRVLHRCTYVSRVPEKVEQRLAALAGTQEEDKKSTLLADVAGNWLLIQKLEPFARGAESKAQLATVLKPHVTRLFPSLINRTRLYVHILNLLADYIGLA